MDSDQLTKKKLPVTGTSSSGLPQGEVQDIPTASSTHTELPLIFPKGEFQDIYTASSAYPPLSSIEQLEYGTLIPLWEYVQVREREMIGNQSLENRRQLVDKFSLLQLEEMQQIDLKVLKKHDALMGPLMSAHAHEIHEKITEQKKSMYHFKQNAGDIMSSRDLLCRKAEYYLEELETLELAQYEGKKTSRDKYLSHEISALAETLLKSPHPRWQIEYRQSFLNRLMHADLEYSLENLSRQQSSEMCRLEKEIRDAYNAEMARMKSNHNAGRTGLLSQQQQKTNKAMLMPENHKKFLESDRKSQGQLKTLLDAPTRRHQLERSSNNVYLRHLFKKKKVLSDKHTQQMALMKQKLDWQSTLVNIKDGKLRLDDLKFMVWAPTEEHQTTPSTHMTAQGLIYLHPTTPSTHMMAQAPSYLHQTTPSTHMTAQGHSYLHQTTSSTQHMMTQGPSGEGFRMREANREVEAKGTERSPGVSK